MFTASDLNLYYDVQCPQWYKRPDWFGVVGVSRLYEQRELRLSYVVWQQLEQERQRVEQERQRAERLAERLRAEGIKPD